MMPKQDVRGRQEQKKKGAPCNDKFWEVQLLDGAATISITGCRLLETNVFGCRAMQESEDVWITSLTEERLAGGC